jgi:uncharacterized Ntn-hydrolase superfamily protein
MNRIISILFISIFYCEDTFSIVAVDPITNEVGSAGASCIAGSIIISDIHPGVGAIHTQSYWTGSNQNYASSLMDLGYSPNEIIEELILNDSGNNPTIRQYGIVDLIDGGRTAAFTGDNCSDYKGHILGDTYAIQGNILLGNEILENMEEEFINAEGNLAKKLMASLQGANIPGADTRCLEDSLSSLSAFIRVAKHNEVETNYYLDINVNNVDFIPYHIDPIDSLQVLFDDWYLSTLEYILGDVNQDQNIDILDVISMVNIILGSLQPNIVEFLSSDINEDEVINIQDVIILIAIILD